MSKTCYRFFGGLLQTQENWLNKMAAQGYRLVSVHKLQYRFEPCPPGEVAYKIDFIGEKSVQAAREYRDFLEDLGYRVFFKNMNLNYSLGKVRLRLWAQKGGRIAANSTTFNRELLIVEKRNDGKPFELHTSFEDQLRYLQTIRKPWVSLLLLIGFFAVYYRSPSFCVWAFFALIPVLFYQYQILQIKQKQKIKES